MSRTETLRPRPRWDLQDTCIAIGLTAIVVGVGLCSIAAALVVGGVALCGLAILWPQQ